MKFIVAPLQLLQEEGPHAFQRALDAAVQAGESGTVDAPISPTVVRFLEFHGAAIRAWASVEYDRAGQGLVYIQDRLDAPAVSDESAAWVRPYQRNEFGGYLAIYIPLAVLRGLRTERAAALATAEYSSAATAVMHCRVAHATAPERLDQPYVCVVQESED